MSIIVQRDATIYSFIIFLQAALHVSDDTLIHHQEHTQNCNYNIWHWSNRIATICWPFPVTKYILIFKGYRFIIMSVV